MIIQIEGLTHDEAKAMFLNMEGGGWTPINIVVNNISLVAYLEEWAREVGSCRSYEPPQLRYTLRAHIPPIKTEVEIAAEKSVEDARKALKSAEKALKKAREK